MANGNMGKPAYQGRPDPGKIADRMMLVIMMVLILGFLQAGMKYGWFQDAIRFMYS